MANFHLRLACISGALVLSACQNQPRPPQLTELDHRRIMAFDLLGDMARDVNPAEVVISSTTECVDLDRAGLSLTDEAARLTWTDRLFLRFLGIQSRFGEWHAFNADQPANAQSGDVLTNIREIEHAATRALLSIQRPLRNQQPDEWPESCQSQYWHQQPIYHGRFALVETGEVAGGGSVGGGKLIALEYRAGAWHVVAELQTWVV